MKRIYFLDRFMFWINVLAAIALLISYLSPYIFFDWLYHLQFLSLLMPVFMLVNIGFVIYWSIRRNKKGIISFIILLIGAPNFSKTYHLPILAQYDHVDRSHPPLKVMSYNVRLFNFYKWIDKNNLSQDITRFVRDKSPDIICFQEFYKNQVDFSDEYPYRYIYYKSENDKMGLAIFSKWLIVNTGTIDFPNTSNNTIYSDILIHGDTIRFYNVHLESMKVDTESINFNTEHSSEIIDNITKRFITQKQQTDLIKVDYTSINYKKVVCGDFNNTPYSYVYDNLKGDLKDCFQESGQGFGNTFWFKFIPLRIDFILVDSSIEVIKLQNYYIKLSDHEPIEAELNL